ALDRAAHRRHDALGLPALVVAEARVHGTCGRDLAGSAAPCPQSQSAVVGLFTRPLDRGGGAGGRPRRAGAPLRNRREAEAVTPALRRIATYHVTRAPKRAKPNGDESTISFSAARSGRTAD